MYNCTIIWECLVFFAKFFLGHSTCTSIKYFIVRQPQAGLQKFRQLARGQAPSKCCTKVVGRTHLTLRSLECCASSDKDVKGSGLQPLPYIGSRVRISPMGLVVNIVKSPTGPTRVPVSCCCNPVTPVCSRALTALVMCLSHDWFHCAMNIVKPNCFLSSTGQ